MGWGVREGLRKLAEWREMPPENERGNTEGNSSQGIQPGSSMRTWVCLPAAAE